MPNNPSSQSASNGDEAKNNLNIDTGGITESARTLLYGRNGEHGPLLQRISDGKQWFEGVRHHPLPLFEYYERVELLEAIIEFVESECVTLAPIDNDRAMTENGSISGYDDRMRNAIGMELLMELQKELRIVADCAAFERLLQEPPYTESFGTLVQALIEAPLSVKLEVLDCLAEIARRPVLVPMDGDHYQIVHKHPFSDDNFNRLMAIRSALVESLPELITQSATS